MTASQRFSYTICFCAALLFLGLSTSFLAPLVTHITGNLGITLSLFSALVILKSLTFSAGSFLLGRIRQRISANRLIAMGLFLLPLLSFIYPRTRSVPLFAAALLIWGISGALIEGGADNRNSELPEEFAGRLNFLQYAAMSIGAMCGPFLLRNAMNRESGVYDLPFFALIPAWFFAVWIWFLPQTDIINSSHEQEGGKSASLSRIVVTAACLMFFACGIDCALNDWSPTAVLIAGITNEANAALMPMAFAVGSLLSRLISAALIRGIRPETIFTFSVSAVLAAAAGMIFTRSYILMLGLQFLFGLGNGTIFSSLLLLLRKRGQADGGSIGFIIGLKNIGDMLIPWLTGIILDHRGAHACFGVLAAGALISFVLHFAVLSDGKTGSFSLGKNE